MIRRTGLLLFTWMLTFGVTAGGERPQVTRHVDFANMKLVLSDGAIRDIQADVDALTRSDKHFQQQLDRVSLYFPIIESIFREENVPEDFKYLVIQESGLISDAVSSAKAVGYWQLKDFTAREMGLRVDNRIDERKNIVSATRAAAKYLKRNNFHFDNWAYALSAYQAGLGGVRKYVDRKNFGSRKMQVSKNTHWYLKKYIAHKIAFEHEIGRPHREGLGLELYTGGSGKDLKEIAREIKVENEFLVFYNKWIKYGKIPADKEYVVIVPTYKKSKRDPIVEIAAEKEIEIPDAVIYPDELKDGLKDKRGIRIKINGVAAIMASNLDELTSLAAIGGLSDKKFRKYNDLSESDDIQPGEIYYLGQKKTKSSLGFHIARERETLWSISQHYGIQVKSLARKNRIGEEDQLKAGQVMWLNSQRPKDIPIEYHEVDTANIQIVPPKPVEMTSAEVVSQLDHAEDSISMVETETESTRQGSEPEATLSLEKVGKTHSVVAGETLWSISRQYDVSVGDLKYWNNLTKYDTLRINQELYVREPKLREREVRKTKSYTVKPGDTLYRIAEAYDMEVTELMDLNNKSNGYLSVGEELKVYK